MSMTVKDLREALAELPDDMPVVQSQDSEGNSIRKTSEVAVAMGYSEDDDWEVETYPTTEEIIASDGHFDPVDDAAPEGSVLVAVLWPVN